MCPIMCRLREFCTPREFVVIAATLSFSFSLFKRCRSIRCRSTEPAVVCLQCVRSTAAAIRCQRSLMCSVCDCALCFAATLLMTEHMQTNPTYTIFFQMCVCALFFLFVFTNRATTYKRLINRIACVIYTIIRKVNFDGNVGPN